MNLKIENRKKCKEKNVMCYMMLSVQCVQMPTMLRRCTNDKMRVFDYYVFYDEFV